MEKSEDLGVIQPEAPVRRGLTRREMVQRLLAGGAAAVAWPVLASGHPIRGHFANAWILDEADEKLGSKDWAPIFLSAQQNTALVELAERIVPGAKKADVNRFIDLLLSVDAAGNQKKFTASLAAIDEESREQFGHPFAALDASQQNAVLRKASEEEAVAAKNGNDAALEKSGKESGAAHAQLTLHDHFGNLKGWITGAYYSSEAGMRELGWNGENVFASYPGCEHEDGQH